MPLLVCTDLDRTLIPNGPQSEPRAGRAAFSRFASHDEITVAYVSGRHRALIVQAISHYQLPTPDYVVSDGGTSIYYVGDQKEWVQQVAWEEQISKDWAGRSHAELKALLQDISVLRLQERSRQNRYKLSYYVPVQTDREALTAIINDRLGNIGVRSNLIWSFEEPRGVGLLDILPARASKLHAIEALLQHLGFNHRNTVFCGDSGNDIEVLASPIPAVLVANAEEHVKQFASELAASRGHAERLYIAQGGFLGMNGNYSGGVLEGIAHYHPESKGLMGLEQT